MTCRDRSCRKEMTLTNEKVRFKGNSDKYWLCDNCRAKCTEEIRFGQSFREYWSIPDKKMSWTYNCFSITHRINFPKKHKYCISTH